MTKQRRSRSARHKLQLLQIHEFILRYPVHIGQLPLCVSIEPGRLSSAISYPFLLFPSELIIPQFLFIDLLLILPIAIFSRFKKGIARNITDLHQWGGRAHSPFSLENAQQQI